jgi:hypothetical protein
MKRRRREQSMDEDRKCSTKGNNGYTAFEKIIIVLKI